MSRLLSIVNSRSCRWLSAINVFFLLTSYAFSNQEYCAYTEKVLDVLQRIDREILEDIKNETKEKRDLLTETHGLVVKMFFADPLFQRYPKTCISSARFLLFYDELFPPENGKAPKLTKEESAALQYFIRVTGHNQSDLWTLPSLGSIRDFNPESPRWERISGEYHAVQNGYAQRVKMLILNRFSNYSNEKRQRFNFLIHENVRLAIDHIALNFKVDFDEVVHSFQKAIERVHSISVPFENIYALELIDDGRSKPRVRVLFAETALSRLDPLDLKTVEVSLFL